MSKIAIIGNIDILLFFKTVGFEVYLLEEKEKLEEKIDLAINQGNQVIFIQEELLKEKEDLLKVYADSVYPLLMPLPIYKDLGLIKNMLSEANLKAVGKPLD